MKTAPTASDRPAWVARAAFVTALGLGMYWTIAWDLANPPETRPPFSEGAAVEYYQAFLLLLASLVAIVSRPTGEAGGLRWLLGAFFAALAIREFDEVIEGLLGEGAWQIMVTAVLLAAIVHGWQTRAACRPAIGAFVRQASWGFFASGILVLLFSRFFGMSDVWYAIMGQQEFQRGVKNAVEEVTETMAIALLALSMLEFWLSARRAR
ncbi:MAG: hypothetical protein AAGE01_13290 [Pseudomonadota bacterium]